MIYKKRMSKSSLLFDKNRYMYFLGGFCIIPIIVIYDLFSDAFICKILDENTIFREHSCFNVHHNVNILGVYSYFLSILNMEKYLVSGNLRTFHDERIGNIFCRF